jgi:hypothetical protein
MGFAGWKKRSEACANVLTYSVPSRSNILRAIQSAYKAGEREGRKHAEAVVGNAVGLAVLVARKECIHIVEEHETWESNPSDYIVERIRAL